MAYRVTTEPKLWREFLDLISGGEKTFPNYELRGFTGWDLGVSRAPTSITLLPDHGSLCDQLSHVPAAMPSCPQWNTASDYEPFKTSTACLKLFMSVVVSRQWHVWLVLLSSSSSSLCPSPPLWGLYLPGAMLPDGQASLHLWPGDAESLANNSETLHPSEQGAFWTHKSPSC